MRKALLAVALVGAGFVATPAQAAIHPYCSNEAGDVDLFGLVGVDHPGTDNNVIGGCVTNHFVGIRYRSDSGGTCVGIVVDNTYLGCT